MDDFLVGSIPSADPYGNRRPAEPLTRRRQPRHDGDSGQSNDEPAGIVEALENSDDLSDPAGESIEDYYLPSDPSSESE